MIHTLIGIAAGSLLAGCGVPQAYKTIKDGHARGIALYMMCMLILRDFSHGSLYISRARI